MRMLVPLSSEPIRTLVMDADGIRTAGEDSASLPLEGLPSACFDGDALLLAAGIATDFDVSPYPRPCPFADPAVGLLGVVSGRREA